MYFKFFKSVSKRTRIRFHFVLFEFVHRKFEPPFRVPFGLLLGPKLCYKKERIARDENLIEMEYGRLSGRVRASDGNGLLSIVRCL